METVTTTSNNLRVPLSNLQLELLKLYSFNIPEVDLLEIKRMLAKFFAQKAMDITDKIWEERKLTNETMDKWLKEDNKNENSN